MNVKEIECAIKENKKRCTVCLFILNRYKKKIDVVSLLNSCVIYLLHV